MAIYVGGAYTGSGIYVGDYSGFSSAPVITAATDPIYADGTITFTTQSFAEAVVSVTQNGQSISYTKVNDTTVSATVSPNDELDAIVDFVITTSEGSSNTISRTLNPSAGFDSNTLSSITPGSPADIPGIAVPDQIEYKRPSGGEDFVWLPDGNIDIPSSAANGTYLIDYRVHDASDSYNVGDFGTLTFVIDRVSISPNAAQSHSSVKTPTILLSDPAVVVDADSAESSLSSQPPSVFLVSEVALSPKAAGTSSECPAPSINLAGSLIVIPDAARSECRSFAPTVPLMVSPGAARSDAFSPAPSVPLQIYSGTARTASYPIGPAVPFMLSPESVRTELRPLAPVIPILCAPNAARTQSNSLVPGATIGTAKRLSGYTIDYKDYYTVNFNEG